MVCIYVFDFMYQKKVAYLQHSIQNWIVYMSFGGHFVCFHDNGRQQTSKIPFFIMQK